MCCTLPFSNHQIVKGLRRSCNGTLESLHGWRIACFACRQEDQEMGSLLWASRYCRPADRCHVALHQRFSSDPLRQSCKRCRTCKENQDGHDASRSPHGGFEFGIQENQKWLRAWKLLLQEGTTAQLRSHPRWSEPGTMVSKDNIVDVTFRWLQNQKWWLPKEI